MSAYLSKYHIGINSVGYILSQKNGIRHYQKKKSPEFVNKFGGGDSSYRDNTFWQFFVQTNWRNGAKQLKFDDAGKFWKSSDVDTSQLEKLTLSHAFVSAGQVVAGVKVNCLEAWRASTSWWDANYGYRQQITITATVATPAGYPIKCTVDTAPIETATHVRSDRKDWRIVYYNGSSWVDLTRDYVSTTATFFATQAAIAAGGSDSNYYVYYGYAAESTTKQPSTAAEWNEVYVPETDANTVSLHHFKEATGTSIADTSGNTRTGTASNLGWSTAGKLGNTGDFNGSSSYVDLGSNSAYDLSSMTLEGWFYCEATGGGISQALITKTGTDWAHSSYQFIINSDGSNVLLSLYLGIGGGATSGASYTWTNYAANAWHHLAATYDGTDTIKLYIDGVLVHTDTGNDPPVVTATSVSIGRNNPGSAYFNGLINHIKISNVAKTSFPHVLATEPTTAYGTETTTQPPASSFDLYAGCSDGKIYKWDGDVTWTEQFNCRQLVWYESGNDANELVGDEGGTEKAKSQGFQLAAATTVSSAQVYIKKNAGTPGAITVTVETDSTNKPSGTKVHDNATGTITAFTTTSYGWVTVNFAGTFALSATTTYHLVLKTAAAANDQNYAWAADASTPGFTSGAQSYSADGGGTWTADTTKDQYFRLLGQASEVNCMLLTSVGGTQKLYVGTGNPSGQTNGDARLYSFASSTWALTKTFASATESSVLSMGEYTDTTKVYLGLGPQAKVYETADFSTFTLSKDINTPQNPGYVNAIKEYNSVLYVGGGSPEFLPDKYYNGFLNYYDSTKWRILYPFDFTVIKSLEFYDAYLFMGTYHGQLYVYDTSSLNPLFSFKDDYDYKLQILDMQYFDDKLFLLTYPQAGTGETNVGIWKFDRRGLSLAHTISGVTGYCCSAVVNGTMFVGTGDNGYVYQLDSNVYSTSGWYQSSYYDANLPNYDKLYNQVIVKHDPLVEGQSITVYYKFKETDSWTTLGTSSTVGDTVEELSFTTGVYSKKISLKVLLTTTNTATTPVLTEVVMKYSLYPTRKWQWTMKLLAKKNCGLLDGTIDTRAPETIRGTLDGLLSTQSLYTFVDIDGVSYNVLVVDNDQNSWVINQNDVNEDEVAITLLEA